MSTMRRGVVVMAAMAMALAGIRADEIQLRSVSLSRGYPKGDVFLHEEGGKKAGEKISVKSFLNHVSETVEVKGRVLVFTTGADHESIEDGMKRLGKIELPRGFSSGIVLFSPGNKEEGTARLIEDTAKAFPVGAVKVVNLSEVDIRIELEGKQYECPAGQELNIVDPPVRENNSSGMRAYRKEGEEWVQVMAGLWPHPGKKRVLQVISRSPRSGKIGMQGVRDISQVGE